MFRIGHGFDAHRLVEGRRLVIGGVELDFPLGLLGHSDADALVHAVCDALLGASALGDIGKLFPDSDAKYKGISSIALLEEVSGRLRKAGFSIMNVDTTIAAEAPKMAPHSDKMRENLAKAMGIEPGQVSIKATTTEKLGFTGRGEGIAAWAVALITSTK
ncbi:MAG: 2-C-methyl-D-erythritol 2,4-cyclodiphosphate synthase [Nitrospinae bacterium]|nr:2-C-methyl-D-erythritol 2,4-cyclodiphosphate synthase [Nitrospinota bacterium]